MGAILYLHALNSAAVLDGAQVLGLGGGVADLRPEKLAFTVGRHAGGGCRSRGRRCTQGHGGHCRGS
jgi:hypothetical protein